MIGILTTLLLVSLIIFYFRRSKKTQNISFDILLGARCLSCKNTMVTESEYNELLVTHSYLLLGGDYRKGNQNINICQCCKRDESIDLLIGKKRKLVLNKIKKYLISSKSNLLTIGLLYSLGGVLILSLVLQFTMNISIFGLSNFINLLYWVIMVYKQEVSSIEKEKHE